MVDFKNIKSDNSQLLESLWMQKITDFFAKSARYFSRDLSFSHDNGVFKVESKTYYICLLFDYEFGDELLRNIRFIFPANDHTSEEPMLYPFKPIYYDYFCQFLRDFTRLTGCAIEKNYNAILFNAFTLKYEEYTIFNSIDWDPTIKPYILCNTYEQLQDVLHVIRDKNYIDIDVNVIVPSYVGRMAENQMYRFNGTLTMFHEDNFLNVDGFDVVNYFMVRGFFAYTLESKYNWRNDEF